MVPKGCEDVNANQCEQRVGQITVDILGGMKNRAVGPDPEIQPEQAEVEYAAVPDEGHDPGDRYDEHQNVEQAVNGTGKAARKFAGVRRKGGGCVPAAPPEPCDDQHPNE